MKAHFLITLLFTTVCVTNFVVAETKVSLGLLDIFNHFIKVTGIIDSVPSILKNIAEDIVDDIRGLIPKVETLADKHNFTEPMLAEIGKALDMDRVIKEMIPELEKLLKDENITETIKEITAYLDLEYIKKNALPEVQLIINENNITEEFEKIKAMLNVTVIADDVLPEIEESLKDENITQMAAEIREILDMADISGKLIPSLERILESHNVSQIVHEIDYLLNLTHLAVKLLTPLQKHIDELKINETIAEIRKFLNMTHLSGMLDDLEKLLTDSNITQDVPDLAPFLDINILRSKLTELDKIFKHYDIAGLLDEVEKYLNVENVIKRVPELDEFLESAGFTTLLQDIKTLLETSFLGDTVKDIKAFILSAKIDDKIHDMELLLNVSYLRRVLVPEIERMVRESNISKYMDKAGNFLNMTYVAENVVTEVEKIWVLYSLDQQVALFVNLTTNMEFLKDFIRKMDEKYKITEKGERISKGDLSGVVNEILSQVFAKRVEKDYEMSFVLSGTDWKESYNDLSSSESKALEDKVLAGLQGAYLLDPSMKGAKVVGFKKVNGKVKVVTVMTFDDSNEDPGAALRETVADGTLGELSVDPDTVGVKDLSTEEEKDDNTAVIVGAVVGSLLGVGAIAAVAGYVVQKQNKKRKVRSSQQEIVGHENGGMTV